MERHISGPLTIKTSVYREECLDYFWNLQLVLFLLQRHTSGSLQTLVQAWKMNNLESSIGFCSVSFCPLCIIQKKKKAIIFLSVVFGSSSLFEIMACKVLNNADVRELSN